MEPYVTADSIESRARDAHYRVLFLTDGAGSVNEDMHLASLLNLAFGFAYVTTSRSIATQVRGQPVARWNHHAHT